MINIYQNIIKQTGKNNISGTELGNKLGLKKSPLTDWKNQKSKPTVDQIIKMCEIFAISADELLFDKESNLTNNEKELLYSFRKLPEREQIKFIARVEDAALPYNK